MKKMIALSLALLLMAALFVGCDQAPKGTLTVSMSPDFSPMEFVDSTKSGQDKFVGFDVSLAKYIAKEMNMELEIKPMDFDACQAAVATGQVDMSISGYSWTEKREANYNMSDFYYAGENETEQVLITLASNGKKYATADALKGLKVGAQGASLQEELCSKQLPDCEIVVYTDINTGLLQLKKGDFDVMAVAIGNANALIAKNPEVAMSGFQFEVSEKETNNLILLKKGNDELTEKVNAILAKAEAAGLYNTWYEEALNTAGVEVSFDAEGNPIVDDEDTTEGDTTEGDTTEGDTTEGDTTEGDTTEGDTTEGDTTEGDTTEGDTTEGDTAEGDTTEGDTTEGTTEETAAEE